MGFATWSSTAPSGTHTHPLCSLTLTLSHRTLLRLLLYPVNVWVFEVTVGYFLLWVWDTRAWIYKGWDAAFDGNIKYGYLPLWLLGGLVTELAWAPFYVPLSGAMSTRSRAALS